MHKFSIFSRFMQTIPIWMDLREVDKSFSRSYIKKTSRVVIGAYLEFVHNAQLFKSAWL